MAHRTPQEALLYWLEAACTVRAPLPLTAAAPSPTPEPHNEPAAASASPQPPSPSPSSPPAPDATDAQAAESCAEHPHQHDHHSHSRRQHSAPPVSRRAPVADAMPLFNAFVAGRLGPVAVDVRLDGHVDLLTNPRLFESTLDAYDKLSSGVLRTALANVQPFFLLPHAAEARAGGLASAESAHSPPTTGPPASLTVYTMDPSNDYPVLPLLAQLLRAPAVTKLLLHGRLLYRLLFLFLGTDRVDVSNVVELGVWSALGRQLRLVRAAASQLPRDGVSQVAEAEQALPPEAARLLTEETRAFAQQLSRDVEQRQQQQQPHHDGSTAALAAVRYSPDEPEAGDDAEAMPTPTPPPPPPLDEEAGAARSSASRTASPSLAADLVGADAEAKEAALDAVQLLRRVRPIGAGDGAGDRATGDGREGLAHAGRKRARTAPHAPPPQDVTTASASSTTALADVYHALRSVTLFAAYVLPELTESLHSDAAGSRPAPLQQQRRSMDRRGAPASAADRPHRLSPTGLCTQRTYVEFLCELMTHHGVFVSETHTHAMMAVLEVQMTTIEDLGLRLAAVVCAGTPDTSAQGGSGDGDGANSGNGVQWSIDLVHRCLRRLPVNWVALSPSRVDVTYLRLLAGAAAHHANAAEAGLLRLGCQLVCAWMAYQDRVGTRTWLSTRFSAVADHMHVRVLERPAESTLSSSSRPPRGAPAAECQVCYSVHPSWLLHNSVTGRINSAAPNVQNIAKAPPRTTFTVRDLAATRQTTIRSASVSSSYSDGHEASRVYDHVDVPTQDDVRRWLALAETGAAVTASSPLLTPLFPEHPQWTMRHLYRAPPGCVLLSFDFNQLELRMLAHLSGDAALQRDLSQEVDVLALVTASVLRLSSVEEVQPQQRQAVKVIVYGLLYGMGPKLMDERIRKLTDEFAATAASSPSGTTSAAAAATAPLSAHELLGRVYHLYPRIESYLRATRQEALRSFTVETLSGLKSLAGEPDANRRKQRGIAMAVQGGAADILHAGMVAVHQHRHRFVPYLPAAPLALMMTIHDELVYAVPRVAVDAVASEVKRILEAQARALCLAVPLPVSVRIGQLFGNLVDYRPDEEEEQEEQEEEG